jgi:hypothetical protein
MYKNSNFAGNFLFELTCPGLLHRVNFNNLIIKLTTLGESL